MDTNYLSAHWHQMKGSVREQFGKLTDDDLLEIGGKVELLVGKLQERYDLSLAEAEAAVTGLKIDAEGMKLETNL
ncbi:CsbD family protein [Thiothrix winogradskyi]|uniref:CsbD family protein n=1 Tax=Thiothrix winogradskyi TaxID=96472 RepID=A0ABY3SV08_9GAMM|nr:CsbD family protein [Thiothrix winogradskyi]UJS22969.1 CsbD family protein [Thiothrix winogradskyi]